MRARTACLQEAYALSAVGVAMLLFYAASQAVTSTLADPKLWTLKLVLESKLLLLGMILHVQWRKVDCLFRVARLPRPLWIAAADCLSFVITFWALAVVAQVFLK